MSKSPLIVFLLAVLTVLTAASAWWCYTYATATRELRRAQQVVNHIKLRQGGMNLLLGETVEYSRKNPAIDPLLEAVGIKGKSNAAPAAVKPAAK